MPQITQGFSTIIKKRTSILLCFVLAVSVLSACGSNKENSTETAEQPGSTAATAAPATTEEKSTSPLVERTVTDELGHEVTVPAEPKRIFAPYMEDSLLTLGIKPVVQWANVDQGFAYLKEELHDVPKLDFSGGLPSPEVLMAYNPDFIILHTAHYAEKGVYEKYSKIAPTYVFNNAAGDVAKSLVTLGELFGKSAEADQALQAYRDKINEAKEKLVKVTEGKKVAIIRFNTRGVNLMGGNYFGGYAVYQDLGIGKPELVKTENSASLSLEILPQIDADIIFIVNAAGQGTDAIKEMTGSSIWKTIPAVKQGQVYKVDDSYWLGGGLIAYGKVVEDVVKLLVK